MPKQDSTPLISSGRKVMTLVDFEQLAVMPYKNDPARIRLFLLFSLWLQKLQGLHVKAILWVDGSFLTEKIGPGDIDCVIWSPSTVSPLTPSGQVEISSLLDHASAKTQFGLDLYFEYPRPDELFHRQAYWMGVFGFQHDRTTAKGFVELSI